MAWFFNLLKSNFHSRGLACFSLFSCAFLPLFPSLSFSSHRPPPVFGSTSPIPYSTAALLWAFLFHMLAGLFLFFFFFFSWGYVLARHHGKPEHSRKKWVYVADQDGKTEGKIHPRQLNRPALLPGRRLDHESKHFSKFLSSGNVDARKLEKRGEKKWRVKTGNLPIHPLLLLNKWFKVQFLAPASLFSHFYPTLSTLKWRWRRREFSLTMILTPLNMTPGSVGK